MMNATESGRSMYFRMMNTKEIGGINHSICFRRIKITAPIIGKSPKRVPLEDTRESLPIFLINAD